MLIILYILSSIIAFLFYLLIRNEFVYQFRIKCINILYSKSNWDKLQKEFHSIGHDTMLFIFWKPLKSFYKGTELYELI